MHSLLPFVEQLFAFCSGQNIILVLARPYQEAMDFATGDIDVLIHKDNIPRIIAWIQSRGITVPSRDKRHDGESWYFYDARHPESPFFHIDFVYTLQFTGMEYLNIKNVFNRRVAIKVLYYMDAVDQLILLLMLHGVKHKSVSHLKKHQDFIFGVVKEFPDTVLSNLIEIFGQAKALEIYDGITKGDFSVLTQGSFGSFTLQSWRRYGLLSIYYSIVYYFHEIFLRVTAPRYIVAFYGVDGAGKTALIQAVAKKLNGVTKNIKICHLLPAFPGQPEYSSGNVLADPHAKSRRGVVTSSLKLFYYLFRYWLAAIYPRKGATLYLYDRYLFDILVDPQRFRYGASHAFARFICHMLPRDQASILVDISAETAQKRKQEVSRAETARQIEGYKRLIQTRPHSIIIKGDMNLEVTSVVTAQHIIQAMAANR